MSRSETIECPSCAMEVERYHSVCPVCDYEFPEPQPGMSVAVWILIGLLLLWMLF